MRRITKPGLIHEEAKSKRFGLTAPEYKHLLGTFKSLTRFVRSGVANPRFIERFVENLDGFAGWSKSNGFGLDRELELINPRIIVGTKLEVKRSIDWQDGARVIRRSFKLYHFGDEQVPGVNPEDHVTDYDLRWVKRDVLVRRKARPLLTSYGQRRLKQRRKPLMLSHDGETKSASAWAKDERCAVSDKIIRQRKEDGWSDTDAITQPRGAKKPGV